MKKIIIILSSLLVMAGIVAGLYYGYRVVNDNAYNYQEIGQELVYCEKTKYLLPNTDASPIKPSFESLDQNIFSVDADGNVETFNPGTATLTIKGIGFEYAALVTVNPHEGIIENCEVPYVCNNCNNEVLAEGGHDFTALSCEEDSYCTICGYVNEIHPGHSYVGPTCEEPQTCSVCGKRRGLPHGHRWVNGDCTTPQNCSVCNKLADKPLGHNFLEATCTEDSVCERCGIPGEEKARGHKILAATCEEPERCEVCDYTNGTALGHKPDKADCTVDIYCTRCNALITKAGQHNFTEATCLKPKTCKVCKKTEGSVLPHTIVEATCTKGSYCSVCKTVLSPAIGHLYVTGDDGKRICAYCGKSGGYSYKASANVDISAYANSVLDLVNAERAAVGLGGLSMDSTMVQAANVRAEEITRSFSHTRPDGSSCFTALSEAGYSYGYAGENIAYGYPSPEAVMNGWMNSEGHRNNILKPEFNYLGVGVYSYNGSIYWVQFFSS